MHTAKVVIGANYGDEGKGLMTDYFASQATGSCLVVRFNGGCQASHTVTLADGRRHAFSHMGSGTFAGAATYLSRHFAVNPPLFLKEREKLNPLLPYATLIYVDERAPVTTFYDMLVNQMVEDFRGSRRHGSCGMGFGETIGRQEQSPHTLVARDLLDKHVLREKLIAIRKEHLPARCAALGLPDFGQYHELCTTDVLVDAFITAAEAFLTHASLVPDAQAVIQAADNVVFEGAQGLLLDQTYGSFPHVTRSNTGLKNVLDVAQEGGVQKLDVTYVTRAYLTRHGAGPLANELEGKPYEAVVDLTNQPNAYQGSLRFAFLDHELLGATIRTDLQAAAGSSIEVAANLAVTCLDQVRPLTHFFTGEYYSYGTPQFQVNELSKKVLPVRYCSFGPTRHDVRVTPATKTTEAERYQSAI
ncbi:adenylosuccinate synthetase [Paraburkholderia sp. A3RO-2L]|jgi:adenylosuccinate synthase|uniref:adenylosuccinate synthetase n=1 Tax=unclassified Paraburkholderia TaxID=2615204 RepID=UPI003DA885D3